MISYFQLSLPHVNVLSKIDLIEKHGKLAFNPDFYTDVLDLRYLLQLLQVRIQWAFNKQCDTVKP